MARNPVFPQLDRLAEYDQDQYHPAPKRRQGVVWRYPNRETPLDEIFTADEPAGKDDDDES